MCCSMLPALGHPPVTCCIISATRAVRDSCRLLQWRYRSFLCSAARFQPHIELLSDLDPIIMLTLVLSWRGHAETGHARSSQCARGA